MINILIGIVVAIFVLLGIFIFGIVASVIYDFHDKMNCRNPEIWTTVTLLVIPASIYALYWIGAFIRWWING